MDSYQYLTPKEKEFKYFFYCNIIGIKKDQYYQIMVKKGLNDIELMLFMNKNILGACR